MADTPAEYDPRYLGGILCFNQHDFFEAHEVWEGLWLHGCGPERRFIQGLIQAAVALYHFGNGNLRGASKLFHSARDYMQKYGDFYLGLDVQAFWQQMDKCFAEVLVDNDPNRRVPLHEELIPTIALDPAPATWPDPAQFETEDED